jgi:TRAP-type C4-dicarboxylate transport system permease small subunit
MLLLLVPVLLQVLSRFIPVIPRYIWTEEIARFAFIWIILIGSSIAVRDQSHFHVDVLPKLSPKREHLLRILLLMLMLLFAFVFVVGGFQFARFGATQSSEISGLPMLTIYIAWPLAGLSWILFIVEQIYRQFYYQQKS